MEYNRQHQSSSPQTHTLELLEWIRRIFKPTQTAHTHTAIKNQSPSPENSSVTRGQDLQMGLRCEASQMMFYSLKMFLAVKEKNCSHKDSLPYLNNLFKLQGD